MTDKPLVAITGASSGIGEATARAFSAAGHPVLLMARRDRPDGGARPAEQRSSARSMCATARPSPPPSAMPRPNTAPTDMMFANAGIARLADIGRQPPEEWDEMIDINTKGVMNTVHAVMKRHDGAPLAARW